MREAEATLNSLALRNARTFKFLSLRAQRILVWPFVFYTKYVLFFICAVLHMDTCMGVHRENLMG